MIHAVVTCGRVLHDTATGLHTLVEDEFRKDDRLRRVVAYSVTQPAPVAGPRAAQASDDEPAAQRKKSPPP